MIAFIFVVGIVVLATAEARGASPELMRLTVAVTALALLCQTIFGSIESWLATRRPTDPEEDPDEDPSPNPPVTGKIREDDLQPSRSTREARADVTASLRTPKGTGSEEGQP